MNNLSLIGYEIKRIIYTRKFFYMVLLIVLVTLDFLTRLLMTGVNGTAPFSQWSFTQLLTMITPFLMIALILMITPVFSEKEEEVRRILWAAPLTKGKYYLIKVAGILIAFFLLALTAIGTTFIYYGCIFNYRQYTVFIKPIICFLLPATFLFLGLSFLVGKIHRKLLYLLVLVAFVFAMNFSQPPWLDIYGNIFLYNWEFTSWVDNSKGVLPYLLPTYFLVVRLIFVVVGLGFLVLVCRGKEKE